LAQCLGVYRNFIKVNTDMGRPPGRVQDRPFQMRVTEEFLRTVDDWRRKQPDLPSRAEAIRRLVDQAVKPSQTRRSKR
jgi:hypothetical protein